MSKNHTNLLFYILLSLILTILIFVLIYNLYLRKKSKREQFISPKLIQDINLFEILKKYFTISDLNQIQLFSKRHKEMIEKLIKRLFGYTQFRDLRNLNIFYSDYPERGEALSLLYQIFTILGARVVRKSRNFFQTMVPEANIYILTDYSNLPVEFVNPYDNNIPPTEEENFKINIVDSGIDRKSLIQIRIYLRSGYNLEMQNLLTELSQNVPNFPQIGSYISDYPGGTIYDFVLPFSEFSPRDKLGFNLNVMFNEVELERVEEEKEREEKEIIEQKEYPISEQDIEALYSLIRRLPYNNIKTFLDNIPSTLLRNKLKDISETLRHPQYDRFRQTYLGYVNKVMNNAIQKEIVTYPILMDLLDNLRNLDTYFGGLGEAVGVQQVGGDFGIPFLPPPINIPQNIPMNPNFPLGQVGGPFPDWGFGEEEDEEANMPL